MNTRENEGKKRQFTAANIVRALRESGMLDDVEKEQSSVEMETEVSIDDEADKIGKALRESQLISLSDMPQHVFQMRMEVAKGRVLFHLQGDADELKQHLRELIYIHGVVSDLENDLIQENDNHYVLRVQPARSKQLVSALWYQSIYSPKDFLQSSDVLSACGGNKLMVKPDDLIDGNDIYVEKVASTLKRATIKVEARAGRNMPRMLQDENALAFTSVDKRFLTANEIDNYSYYKADDVSANVEAENSNAADAQSDNVGCRLM